MNMSKFVETDYTSPKNILKFEHYVAMGVTVSDEGITANADGKKIVPAGTIVGGIDGRVLDDDTKQVEQKNTQGATTGAAGAAVDAEGVLLNDVDVTYGPESGSMIIHGFIGLGNLPAVPAAEAVTALAGRILFIK